MEDNKTVTHGLHWLTSTAFGWECAHPDCDWHMHPMWCDQNDAQDGFDYDHAKLSEAEASVQP